tara:strand:- start:13221 stop:15062 length:1842 start_codon:yes stop_codon:yes gene_type:complete
MALNKDIKYINRDFTDFRNRLIEYTKTYFPNTYNDFSPTSPGMMFIEQASYVGDVLSFYLDNQFQETFIQYAQQTNNVFELAYMFGYKPKTTGVAQVNISLFQQVPSKLSDGVYIPDLDYCLTIEENTSISTNNNINFLIQDKCDFSISNPQDPTEVSVYQVSDGNPQYFLLKKNRIAISAEINTTTFTFNEPQPFTTINLPNNNIIKVLDIKDSDDNTWYEVDNLGQEMVLDTIKNTNVNNPNKNDDTPYLLRLKKVARRFSTRFTSLSNLQIQFGVGTPETIDEEITPNPNNVGLGLPFKQDKLTAAYSPTNFLYTNTYGISPSNTTLTVRYLTGGGVNSNVFVNELSNLDKSNTKFKLTTLNTTTSNYVFDSLTATNEEAATGGKGGDTLEEIRQNTLSLIASQKRSVTSDDYLIRALSMPSDFGSITKAIIQKPQLTDSQISTIETLSLYILSQNNQSQLSVANNTLKQNLRTYLSQYRMIGDNIEIRDAYIINIGIDFELIVLPEYNNSEVLIKCIDSLKEYFNINNWQINQPIQLRDIYVRLDKIKGVQTVKNINIKNIAGESLGYSPYAYDIVNATQNQVIYPSLDPSIFEIKYPNTDIKGRVVSL